MEQNGSEPQEMTASLESVASGSTEVVRERSVRAVAAVRGTVGNLQAVVADVLEDSAKALRRRVGGEGEGEIAADESARARLETGEVAVAAALEHSAMWLRENDLTELRPLVDRQLREHPGRTALLALGVGFLLGRVSRR